jgi:hypothetical protein
MPIKNMKNLSSEATNYVFNGKNFHIFKARLRVLMNSVENMWEIVEGSEKNAGK